jgi:hypothetical protein
VEGVSFARGLFRNIYQNSNIEENPKLRFSTVEHATVLAAMLGRKTLKITGDENCNALTMDDSVIYFESQLSAENQDFLANIILKQMSNLKDNPPIPGRLHFFEKQRILIFLNEALYILRLMFKWV